MKKYIDKNVYKAYIPQGDYAYDRTYELLNSVTVGDVKVSNNKASFEVYMNTELIGAYSTGAGRWNQHMDVYGLDVSKYIPLWIEDGTSGGLWDRSGAGYMADSFSELSGGSLTRELKSAMRAEGWNVVG